MPGAFTSNFVPVAGTLNVMTAFRLKYLPMIHALVICKNELFFRCIEPLVNLHGIYFSALYTEPEKAFRDYTALNLHPDVIIVDASWNSHPNFHISDISGFLKANAAQKLIMVTTFYEEIIVAKVKDIGADGYFYRNTHSVESIVACIKAVHRGDRFLAQAS